MCAAFGVSRRPRIRRIIGRTNLRKRGITIVLNFLRLRVPFGFRVFFSCRLKRGLSCGAKYSSSSSSIIGRVIASTMAVSSMSARRLLLFFFADRSIESKSNDREAFLFLWLRDAEDDEMDDIDAERVSDEEVLTPDYEREIDATAGV